MITGQRIRTLRKERDLTQEQLGEVLNVGKSTISQYENNVNQPDTDTILKLAEFFGVSTDFILGNTDLRNPLLAKEVDLLDEKVKFFLNGQPLSDDEMEDIRHDIQLARQLRQQWIENKQKEKK